MARNKAKLCLYGEKAHAAPNGSIVTHRFMHYGWQNEESITLIFGKRIDGRPMYRRPFRFVCWTIKHSTNDISAMVGFAGQPIYFIKSDKLNLLPMNSLLCTLFTHTRSAAEAMEARGRATIQNLVVIPTGLRHTMYTFNRNNNWHNRNALPN